MIIPGFGGFIAHHVNAQYDNDDRLFLPPYRTLGFNPQLILNDSLLVQSYVETYDVSYPDALRQIEAEVDELKDILYTEGIYDMNGIGVLRVNSDGNIEFKPCEAGILSPEEYGLSDFSFKRLKDAKPLEEKATTVHTEELEDLSENDKETVPPALLDFTDEEAEEEHQALIIKMSWVRNAVAIAAAVACFFLLATPVANSDLGNKTMSQLHGNIIYRLMPKDSNMTPAQPIKEVRNEEVKEVKSEKTKSVREVDKKPEIKDFQKGKDTYCIVLASQVKRSNAEEYVEQLKRRGIADARIYMKNNILRVVCGQFDNQAQAYQQLNKMAIDDEFAEAWVYKQKTDS